MRFFGQIPSVEPLSTRQDELAHFDLSLVLLTGEVNARRKRRPVRILSIPAHFLGARGLRTLDQTRAQPSLQIEDAEMNDAVTRKCERDRGPADERIGRGFSEQRQVVEPGGAVFESARRTADAHVPLSAAIASEPEPRRIEDPSGCRAQSGRRSMVNECPTARRIGSLVVSPVALPDDDLAVMAGFAGRDSGEEHLDETSEVAGDEWQALDGRR